MTVDLSPVAAEFDTPDRAYTPPRIGWESVELLTPAAGSAWGKLADGRYLRLVKVRAAFEVENPWKPGRVAIVRKQRVTDDRFGLPGGGHPSSVVEQLTEAQLATDSDYRAALAADKAKAERRDPPPRPVRLGPSVTEVRARLKAGGLGWSGAGGHLLLTTPRRHVLVADRELARAYAALLLQPDTKCARCKSTAEYMAEVDVPLCAKHAEVQR